MVNERNQKNEYLFLSERDPDCPDAGFWVDRKELKKACKIRHAWARTIHTFQVTEIVEEQILARLYESTNKESPRGWHWHQYQFKFLIKVFKRLYLLNLWMAVAHTWVMFDRGLKFYALPS